MIQESLVWIDQRIEHIPAPSVCLLYFFPVWLWPWWALFTGPIKSVTGKPLCTLWHFSNHNAILDDHNVRRLCSARMWDFKWAWDAWWPRRQRLRKYQPPKNGSWRDFVYICWLDEHYGEWQNAFIIKSTAYTWKLEGSITFRLEIL